MTLQTPITAEDQPARHARLFELIRQSTLASIQSQKPAPQAPASDAREFAQHARKSLSPQEQKTLGISESFGR